MSKVRHDSKEAEELALVWHRIGTVLSILTVISGLGGAFWHIWAERQHKAALRVIR